MKKYIWAIAAVIMVAGTISFVACNKDNDNNQIVNPSYVSAKGGSTLNQLRNVMVAYYAACDSAYQADSTTFLSVCANNDTTNFLKVTGISSEMMAAYRTLALQELEDFVKDNPSFKPDENPCTSCSYNALPRLGTLASATSGHMAALVPFKIGGNDRQRLANCISWCEIMTTPCGMTACISACMGEYYKYMKQLDLAYFTNGTTSYTFDMDNISEQLSAAILEHAGEEIIVENILVVDSMPFTKNWRPEVKISFFNVKEEEGVTAWYYINKEINDKGDTVRYYATGDGGNNGGNQPNFLCKQGKCKGTCHRHATYEGNNMVDAWCECSGDSNPKHQCKQKSLEADKDFFSMLWSIISSIIS